MNSNAQVFSDLTTAFRTFNRSPPCINQGEKLSTLPTHVFDNASKLSECSIKHLFSKHPFSRHAVIQVFHEDRIPSITKSVSLFVVKVLPGVVDLVIKSGYLNSLFLVILRPFLFSRESALQQFKLALQPLKELRRFYENAVTGCQKLGQPNVNTNRMSVWNWVWNVDITLQRNRGIPSVSFPGNSYLLEGKPYWDRSMQVNWDCSNLGKFDMNIRYLLASSATLNVKRGASNLIF
jgi:hypothetical protein